MKNLIRIEELAMTAIALYFISTLDIYLKWWLYPIIFFSPDVGMLGYLINNKTGAIIYNIFHHKAVG